ncbi:hypothetical protein IW139_000239 [Coemansia sp. RSA 353]|nr:hypothetical protein IW142_003787 [Coemansia sp. RSA 564]KAJ2167323.1 hypothetical protein GGH16_003930 [Coemansia sp. RSA 560]KAJ2168058.1 hypothetical protein GGH15_001687 [Coemansia sp. RSA 562]KAJ2293725.1 hypothetical protein IW141_000962 [Coemansia sp. RSA 355]KAJ2301676.1 hypothetical protein IW139_000239 [Coemansia sp. RSA 353]KAJ2728386.1 hypothetical protein H4S00_000994 [Coemansia sp. D1744]
MSDTDDLDLFGDVSTAEQAEHDKLQAQRRNQAPVDRSPLDYQRRRYLQSHHVPPTELGFETLRNRHPLNFGQIFSAPERQQILDSVSAYVEHQGWTTQRHGAFPTRDIPTNVLSIAHTITSRLEQTLFPRLHEHTGIDIKYWTFRDIFIVGYHEAHQRSLNMHSDGSLASLTLLLNEPCEFDGGGTFFEKFALRIEQVPGDAWIHDGRLDHSGVAITRGKRLVLVAFIDTIGGYTDILRS